MGSLYGAIDNSKSSDFDEQRMSISVGRVMDTNDPLQMGRLRVFCPGLDNPGAKVGDLPFAIYCSPLAGHQQVQSRGPEDGVVTTGPVAYGMFNIPKVGTDVLIAHLNGDPNLRFWFGALYGLSLSNTLPHGRYTFNNPNAGSGDLDGPLSSAEQPIQPLYKNQTTQYTRTSAIASNDGGVGLPPRKNFEWRVRGADFQGSGLGNIQKNLPGQKVASMSDDRNFSYTEEDGTKFHQGNFTQGSALSRIEPNATYDPGVVDGGQNLDPQTYSWTSPGFSSIALDDRPENCRIRIRTGTGHQIILDDTNERIYISTVDGNNWIEMDQDGSVDIYAARRVSIHAAMDVNITSDQTFRVYAKEGIHMTSGGDIRITATGNTELNSTGTTNIASTGNMSIQTSAELDVNSSANTNIQSGADVNVLSTSNVNVEGSTVNILGDNTLKLSSTTTSVLGNNTTVTGSETMMVTGLATIIQGATTLNMSSGFFNGDHFTQTSGSPVTDASSADSATSATVPNPKEAYFTNRVPEHEPWGRIMMKQGSTDQDSGNNFTLELSYTDPNVGRMELGQTIPRNSRWHR